MQPCFHEKKNDQPVANLRSSSDKTPFKYLKGGDVGDGPVGGAGVPVASSDDAEEAVLAPVGAPGVAADPVVHAVLGAPAVDLDGVVGGLGVAGVVHVDAAGVGLDALGVNIGGHGAAGVDLSHDVVVSGNGAVLGQGDLGVVGDGIWESKRSTVRKERISFFSQ